MSTTSISFRRVASHNLLATIGVVLVLVFVVFALFAPWIAPQDPAHIDLPTRLSRPSSAHWCGTDELGRDILSRLIYGSRISMLVGSCVVAASLAVGLIVGSLAGYYGGRLDRFINIVVMNAFLSFPGILLAIAFVGTVFFLQDGPKTWILAPFSFAFAVGDQRIVEPRSVIFALAGGIGATLARRQAHRSRQAGLIGS